MLGVSGPERVAELYVQASIKADNLDAEARRTEAAFEKVATAGKKAQEGVDGAGAAAEKSSLSFGKVAAGAGALAASAGLVAAAFAAMTDKINRGVAATVSAMPSLTGQTAALRKEIESLSLETGKSQGDLSALFAKIAESGVQSFTELRSAMRATLQVSEATGKDLESSLGSIDLALDAFGLSAGKAGEAAARLFATAQGRVKIDELTAAIQASVPTVRTFGLSFETTTAALAKLLEQGHNPRQAAQQIKDMAEEAKDGAAAVRDFAGAIIPTAEAMERLQEAARVNSEDAAKLATILRAQLSAEMLRLGNDILPTVLAGLRGTITLLRELRQAAGTASLFEGLEIQLPDSGRQLREFLKSNDILIRQAQQQVEAAQKAADDAARIKPVDFLSLGGIGTRPARTGEANAALQESIDFLEKLQDASDRARQKLEDLKRTGGNLPEITVVASRGTSNEMRQRVEAARRALADLQDLASLSRATLSGSLDADLTKLQQKLRDLVTTTAGGGAEALQEARALASQILEDFLAESQRDLAASLSAFVQESGAKARTEVIRNAAELAEAREKFRDTIRGNLEQSFEANVTLVGHLLTKDEQRLTALRAQADAMQANVDTSLQLLEVLGLIDSAGASFLSNIGQAVTGIGPLVDALSAPRISGSSILNAALPVAGGIGGIISGLQAAFADSPALIAAREALDNLREELEENTLTLREVNLSGSEISGTNKAIDQFIEQGLPRLRGRSRISTEGIEAELEKFGLTLEDIEDLAGRLDDEFIPLTRETIPQFLEMLELFGVKLDQITKKGLFDLKTPQGRLDKFTTGVQFSDEKETVGQIFQGMLDAAAGGTGGAGFLAPFFQGFKSAELDDPKTAEAAKAAARAIMERVFEAVTSEGFDPNQLGDFTADEFLTFLESLLGVIPDAIDAVTPPIKTAAELFADAMGKISLAARVFDFSDLEIIGQQLEAMAASFPAFAEAISGIDLDTSEGVNSAILVLQSYFAAIEEGSISIAGAGFTVDDLVSAIDGLQGVVRETEAELERQRERRRQRDAEERRDNDAAYRDEQNRQAEIARENQRAHDEYMRQLEEQHRARLALGSDSLRALEEFFDLNGITEVVDQLNREMQLLSQLSPVFSGLLGGVDAGNAGDRAEALQRLRDFQLTNPFGQESGNLSADAVRSAVVEIGRTLVGLNAVEVTGGTGSTGSFSIDRSITEVRGERLEGQLATSNIFLEQIAGSAAAIEALLGRPFGGIEAPSLPAGFGIVSAPVVGTMVLNFAAAPSAVINNPEIRTDIRALVAEIARYQQTLDSGGV